MNILKERFLVITEADIQNRIKSPIAASGVVSLVALILLLSGEYDIAGKIGMSDEGLKEAVNLGLTVVLAGWQVFVAYNNPSLRGKV
jgi:hypothetical protein